MNREEILKKIDNAYLPFNLLSGNFESELNTILSVQKDVDESMIVYFIERGESWREQLVGLILASSLNVKLFYKSYILCLKNPRYLTIFPAASLILISIKYFECASEIEILKAQKPSGFIKDYELAISNIEFYLGLNSTRISEFNSSGQNFDLHYTFYRKLCGVL